MMVGAGEGWVSSSTQEQCRSRVKAHENSLKCQSHAGALELNGCRPVRG